MIEYIKSDIGIVKIVSLGSGVCTGCQNAAWCFECLDAKEGFRITCKNYQICSGINDSLQERNAGEEDRNE